LQFWERLTKIRRPVAIFVKIGR